MTQQQPGWQPPSQAPIKAPRPWYKKKRFIIPLVLLVLGIIGGISGGSKSGNDTSTTTAANVPATPPPSIAAATSAAPPPTTAPPATTAPASPAAPVAPAVTYVGKLKDDKLAGDTGAPGGEVKLSGWTTMAGPLASVKDSFTNNLCTSVTLTNRDTKQQDYNAGSWKLQSPGGNVADVTFGGDNDLAYGGLAPGGKVTKNVCFENPGEPGQYILSWQPDIYSSKARGVWLQQL